MKKIEESELRNEKGRKTYLNKIGGLNKLRESVYDVIHANPIEAAGMCAEFIGGLIIGNYRAVIPVTPSEEINSIITLAIGAGLMLDSAYRFYRAYTRGASGDILKGYIFNVEDDEEGKK